MPSRIQQAANSETWYAGTDDLVGRVSVGRITTRSILLRPLPPTRGATLPWSQLIRCCRRPCNNLQVLEHKKPDYSAEPDAPPVAGSDMLLDDYGVRGSGPLPPSRHLLPGWYVCFLLSCTKRHCIVDAQDLQAAASIGATVERESILISTHAHDHPCPQPPSCIGVHRVRRSNALSSPPFGPIVSTLPMEAFTTSPRSTWCHLPFLHQRPTYQRTAHALPHSTLHGRSTFATCVQTGHLRVPRRSTRTCSEGVGECIAWVIVQVQGEPVWRHRREWPKACTVACSVALATTSVRGCATASDSTSGF